MIMSISIAVSSCRQTNEEILEPMVIEIPEHPGKVSNDQLDMIAQAFARNIKNMVYKAAGKENK